jgi:cardiolipin synthase A/B
VNPWGGWFVAHLATVAATVLVVPFLARILHERRPQGSTIAWLLVVIAIPYVGIPLYLVLGPRKRSTAKGQLYPAAEEQARSFEPPIARLVSADGIRGPTGGNDVRLLGTGELAFQEILGLIDGARRSIHITTFIVGDDETGNTILERLGARAAAGVEVRLLVDGLFAIRANRRRLADLRRAGGRVTTFAPLLHLPFRGSDNLRNHRKIAVFDGTDAIIGGMNLAEEYMGATPLATRWCDLCARVRGPAVRCIDEIFRADWAFATKEALDGHAAGEDAGPTRIQVVPSGPDSAGDALYDAILTACYSAQRRVWIATPYFVPDEALTRALSGAARRGLDVLVIVPDKSNHPLADLAGGAALRQVARAGGRVATYPRMLHAKAVVIDDEIGILGSANFDMRSLFLDYEVALFVYSSGAVADLAAWFSARAAECGELRPPTRLRLLGEDVGRLIAPLV